MNMNEVLATRQWYTGGVRGMEQVHPNDDVSRVKAQTMCSPTAMHVAALLRYARNTSSRNYLH